ncbi:MAG: hypothetical protein R2854_30605 [Caldilineaceae bacterium]
MTNLFADHFAIQRELGRGSFGVVHLALDTRLGNRAVALKVLHPALNADPQTLALFETEAGLPGGVGPRPHRHGLRHGRVAEPALHRHALRGRAVVGRGGARRGCTGAGTGGGKRLRQAADAGLRPRAADDPPGPEGGQPAVGTGAATGSTSATLGWPRRWR